MTGALLGCLIIAPILIAGLIVNGRPPELIEAATAPLPTAGLTKPIPAARTVCFKTTLTTDPMRQPLLIQGTEYSPADPSFADTAILLIHGAMADRRLWDAAASRVGEADSTSLPLRLAQQGYLVYSIDLLGDYGQSPYAGGLRHGSQLTPKSYAAQIHDVVHQLRAHGGAPSLGACQTQVAGADNAEIRRVILAGHGFGAMLARHYVTDHANVDGLISLAWADAGISSEAQDAFAKCQADRLPTDDGYAFLLCPDRSGRLSECDFLLFWKPGADNATREAACQPARPIREPTGMLVSPIFNGQPKANLGRIKPMPALFVYGEHDRMITVGASDDAASWAAACACFVERFVQQDSGHLLMLHANYEATTERIAQWLAE